MPHHCHPAMNRAVAATLAVLTATCCVVVPRAIAHAATGGMSSHEAPVNAARGISKDEASVMALVDVPGGSIRSTRLESYAGRRVWAVAVREPQSFQVVTLRFDATTGERVASPGA